MKGVFFGDYLVGKGIITDEKLKEAIGFQKENNVLLGELAIRDGCLSRPQLVDLLHNPDTLNMRLGQALMAKGFITREGLDRLLGKQANNHAFLGSALVRLGHLSPQGLDNHLETYRNVANTREDKVQRAIETTFAGDYFGTILDYVRTFFYRLGYLSKTMEISDSFPDSPQENVFSAEQKHKKTGTHFLCFSLPDEFVVQIAQGFGHEEETISYHEMYEDVAQSFFNLNYAICAGLRKAGHPVHYDAIMRGIPDHSQCTTAHMSTILGDYKISYVR